MSSTKLTLRRVLFSDLLALRPPEYYILAHDDRIQFVRATRKVGLEVLYEESVGEDQIAALESFCRNLSTQSVYFGQPVRILIANRQAFTYFKRLDKTSPAQLLEKLQALPRDRFEIRQKTVQLGDQRFFTLQAIDRDYLKAIGQSGRSCGLNTIDIATLNAQLFATGPTPGMGKAASCLFCLAGEREWYSVFSANGDILIASLPEAWSGKTAAYAFEQMDAALHNSGPAQHVLFTGDLTAPQSSKIAVSPLGRLFQVGPKRQSVLKTLSYRLPSSRFATGLKVALNSSRLLVSILAGITLLLGLATGVTGVWSTGLAEPLEHFQHRYSSRLSLLQQLDRLKAEERTLLSVQGNPRQTAAIVSSFCQQVYSGLFLTELSVRYSPGDSIAVDARGTARREATVFAWRDHLAEQLLPYPVTVNSLRPRRSQGRGTLDSVFTFGVTATLYD